MFCSMFLLNIFKKLETIIVNYGEYVKVTSYFESAHGEATLSENYVNSDP